jgi:hypothetical protein
VTALVVAVALLALTGVALALSIVVDRSDFAASREWHRERRALRRMWRRR